MPTTERPVQYTSYMMRTGTYLWLILQHSILERMNYFHGVYKESLLYLKEGNM